MPEWGVGVRAVPDRAVDEGIGFTYIVSTGNEADLDFCDFARYLLDDDDTRVIAGFVEGFKDGRKFLEVARMAAERGKPIVLIKIGRSDLGSRAAGSHTAALTGVDEVYEAAFAQYGVIRVQDYDDLLQVSNMMARCPRPSHRGVAAVSHSGGISSLTADMFGQAGLDLPPLSDRARDGINDILKGFGWAANPSDVTGFANSDDFPAIMSFMAADEASARWWWHQRARTRRPPRLSPSETPAGCRWHSCGPARVQPSRVCPCCGLRGYRCSTCRTSWRPVCGS